MKSHSEIMRLCEASAYGDDLRPMEQEIYECYKVLRRLAHAASPMRLDSLDKRDLELRHDALRGVEADIGDIRQAIAMEIDRRGGLV
jgi:hypothetical protein